MALGNSGSYFTYPLCQLFLTIFIKFIFRKTARRRKVKPQGYLCSQEEREAFTVIFMIYDVYKCSNFISENI